LATYDYRCMNVHCAHEQEVIHGMMEEPEIRCEICGTPMKKIIKSVNRTHFKTKDGESVAGWTEASKNWMKELSK